MKAPLDPVLAAFELEALEVERDRLARLLARGAIAGPLERTARRTLERLVAHLISPRADAIRAASAATTRH